MFARATVLPGVSLRAVADHLYSQGFKGVFTALVSAGGPGVRFTEEDLRDLEADLVNLADRLVASTKERTWFWYRNIEAFARLVFHGKRRTRGCRAGTGYLAVAPDGGLYPCHRFVGEPDWRMGSVDSGLDPGARDRLRALSVDSFEGCGGCWIRYLCGGGCLYHRWISSPGLDGSDPVFCRVMEAMVRAGIRAASRLEESDVRFLQESTRSLGHQADKIGI